MDSSLYNLKLVCVCVLLLLSDTRSICTANTASLSANCSTSTHIAEPLYLLSLLPYKYLGPEPRERDLLPAAQLAVEYINCDKDLLNGYKLVLIDEDGGCDVVHSGVQSYLNQVLYNGNRSFNGMSRISAVIGSACFKLVSMISSLTNRVGLGVPNIHLVNSPMFENRAVFPLTFGILGSSIDLVETVFSLMQRNGWTKISLLYEDGSLSISETVNYLKERLKGIGELVFESLISDHYIPVTITQLLARVVVVLASSSLVQKVMCQAYKEGMVYPTYQWILLGNSLRELKATLTYEDVLFNCSSQELADVVLTNSLFIDHSIIDLSPKTDVGITYNNYIVEYRKQFKMYYNHTNYTLQGQSQSTLLYDAVWALALALNTTLKDKHCDLPTSNRLENDCGVSAALSTLSFQGISGYINIANNTGYNRRIVNLFQISDSMEHLVGQYYNRSLTIFNTTFNFIANAGSVEHVRVKWGVSVFVTIVTLFQLAIIICLHIVSIVYRDYKSIKASNPRLHHLIFIGCYLIVLSEFMYVWPLKTIQSSLEQEALLCLVTLVWMLPLSWTLIFATLIAHAWRLYRIFAHYTNPGRYISDCALCIIISVQISIDLLLATLWSTLDPTLSIPLETSMISDQGVPIIATMCVNKYQFVWFPLLFGYKLLQLFVLFVLSVLTRDIKTKDFATRKYKVASYLICAVFVFLSTIFASLYYFNAEIHADFVVYCVLANSILFLCYSFILFPPVFPLLREKLTGMYTRQEDYVGTKSSAVFL